tara:strand:- start:71874 stop:72449 length:576 start_codon:yes stop_codon:yes gene_type:complete
MRERSNLIRLVLFRFWKEPTRVILEGEYRGHWILPALVSIIASVNVFIAGTSSTLMGDPFQDFVLQLLLFVLYSFLIYALLVKVLPFIYFKLGGYLGGSASFSDIQYAVILSFCTELYGLAFKLIALVFGVQNFENSLSFIEWLLNLISFFLLYTYIKSVQGFGRKNALINTLLPGFIIVIILFSVRAILL